MDTATRSPLAARIKHPLRRTPASTSAARQMRPDTRSTACVRNTQSCANSWSTALPASLQATQQQVILAILEAAPAPDLAPLLQQWSRSTAFPLPTRARAIEAQEHDNGSVDTAYRNGLVHAGATAPPTLTAAPSPLDDNDALASPWSEELAQLPLDLRLDVARNWEWSTLT